MDGFSIANLGTVQDTKILSNAIRSELFKECMSMVSIKWSAKSFNLFLNSLPTLSLPLTGFVPKLLI